MLFSQLPIFYRQSIISAIAIIICDFKLNFTYLLMLPSPSSSLSSFRDYYRHTSEASEDMQTTSEELIRQGLANFIIMKVFTKINLRVSQEIYWTCFYAFRKIRMQHSRKDSKANATVLFGKILKKRAHGESKMMVQVNALKEMMDSVKVMRKREVMMLMHFGMKLMKRKYIIAAFWYHQIIAKITTHPLKGEQKPPITRQQKILRLSKAILCICIRKADKRVSQSYRMIKYTQHFRDKVNKQQITFFKPKRQKIYEHRREGDKLDRLFKVSKLIQLFQKKKYLYMKTFLMNIMPNGDNSNPQSLQDSKQIFANIAQHMIYLTSISKHVAKSTKSQKDEIKLFKLAQVLKKDRRRVRSQVRQCLLLWRRAANEQRLMLKREILKLEMIKKHYMDEF